MSSCLSYALGIFAVMHFEIDMIITANKNTTREGARLSECGRGAIAMSCIMATDGGCAI